MTVMGCLRQDAGQARTAKTSFPKGTFEIPFPFLLHDKIKTRSIQPPFSTKNVLLVAAPTLHKQSFEQVNWAVSTRHRPMHHPASFPFLST